MATHAKRLAAPPGGHSPTSAARERDMKHAMPFDSEYLPSAHVSVRHRSSPANREGVDALLQRLQAEQLRHDRGYHVDILQLPFERRMSHFALHMAKYAGKFVRAAQARDDERYHAMIVDACIIALAAANTLAERRGEAQWLQKEFASAASVGWREFGLDVARKLEPAANRVSMSFEFLDIVALFAKACESQDHAEPYDSVSTMRECVRAFLRLVLAQAAHAEFDVASGVASRWRAVEAKVDRTRANKERLTA